MSHIETIVHPEYDDTTWQKYELAYCGDRAYVNKYLRKMSTRESKDDFNARKNTAYIPRYAGAAIDEVKNAILQRLVDIVRVGGPDTYKNTIHGSSQGVDYQNSSMTSFMGDKVLRHVLVTGKVGVLVDNHPNVGPLQRDQESMHPYVKLYKATEIRSWRIVNVDQGFETLLLREYEDVLEDGLVSEQQEQYRMYKLIRDENQVPSHVEVTVYTYQTGPRATDQSLLPNDPIVLDITRIPFTVIELEKALMQDIADMQTELMNMESSDVSYVLKSNFPFYLEFYDPNTESPYTKSNVTAVDDDGEFVSGPKEIEVGSQHGKKVPDSTRAPQFIAPPAETLQASMAKGDQIRKMIRAVRNLNLQSLVPQRESAESKRADQTTMEAALSVIAQELEIAERDIAKNWAMFDKSGEAPDIIYPETYNLQPLADRIADGKELIELSADIPSETFKKTVYSKVVHKIFGVQIDQDKLQKITKELTDSIPFTDQKLILELAKEAIMTKQRAATLLGLPENEVQEAIDQRIEFIEKTIEAQGGELSSARGVTEVGDDKGKEEKEGKQKRGKNVNSTE